MTAYRPMKAHDLSTRVAWGSSDPFAPIAGNLTDEWVAEPKIDGNRFHLTLGADGNTVGTQAHGYTAQFPHLAGLVRPDIAGTVLDGELTYAGGMATGVAGSNPHRAVATQRRTEWAVFHAFDVLAVNGTDVTRLPYEKRREMLAMVVTVLGSDHVRLVEQMPATAASITAALDAGLEGVVLKRRTSTVRPGTRSGDWLKVKRTATGEFYVIGSEPGEGGNAGLVGSLKVAWWDASDEANPVRYCGKVGGGMSHRFRVALSDPERPGRVRPEWIGRVVEVAAQEVTGSGRLRHPRFVRVREDKDASECGPEQIGLFHRQM